MINLKVSTSRLFLALFSIMTLCAAANASEYKIDPGHTFIEFHIKHLGYSWLYGRFNTLDGKFSYDDKNPETSAFAMTIDPASIDTNHAERDKHLRGEDFLDVSKFSEASFKSTEYIGGADSGVLNGMFTLHGVTKPIAIKVIKLGEGSDPWGGYRAGFEGKTTLKLGDYGINYDLGPASKEVEMVLGVEGIRQ